MPRRAIPILGLVFVLYAATSLVWLNEFPLWSASLLGSLVLCFIVGYKTPDVSIVWWSIAWGVSILTMAQAFDPVITNNIFGAIVAITLAGAITHRLYWFIPIATFGLWLSNSRTAILASIAVSLVALWRRYPVTAYAITALGLIYISVIDHSGPVDSISSRLGIWQDTINHLTIFGSGWGSFAEAYASWPVRTNMTTSLAPHAYNDALELIFELGIGVIPLWLMIILSLEASSRSSSLILLSFTIISLFFFPLYLIPVGQLFAMTLGNLARERTTNGQMASTPASLSQYSRY